MNGKKRKNAFGTHSIAKICEVTPPTVGRWIAEGKLPSFTTGGGHHRVRAEDLVIFLKSHNMTVPEELNVRKSLKILVVDDDPAIRKFIEKVILSYLPQAEVHKAKDGFEAGHKVTFLLPTLTILDLRLPGLDGIKVCEMIKQNENLNDTKVLAMTGYQTEKAREKIFEAGADGFLQKPFESKKLVEMIQKLIGTNIKE